MQGGLELRLGKAIARKNRTHVLVFRQKAIKSFFEKDSNERNFSFSDSLGKLGFLVIFVFRLIGNFPPVPNSFQDHFRATSSEISGGN